MTMRLAVLSIGDPATYASTRFRVSQYLGIWGEAGVSAEIFWGPGSVDRLVAAGPFDTVIVQKTLLPSRDVGLVRRAGGRMIFDLDDATWSRPGRPFSWPTRLRLSSRFRSICRHADLCVASNRVIADRLAAWGGRVRVIGMALDVDHWRPSPRPDDGNIVIGWAGAPGNLPFLARIAGVLASTAAANPRIHLRALCGRDPGMDGIPGFAWTPWTPDAEIPFVQALDIGVLPLPDDEFARGKSPIKALQYQACGVATIGDGVGASRELLVDGRGELVHGGDWTGAIGRLAADHDLRRRIGAAGRAAIERDHDIRVCAQAWLDCLRGT